MKRLLPFAAATIALLSQANAQTQMNLITGAAGSTAYINGSSEHRMAVAMNGDLYAVIKLGSPLAIMKSTDQGATWTTVATDTTGGNPSGTAIVADPGCDLMHVGFHARVNGNREAPHYRAFDTSTDSWVGPATLVSNLSTPTQDWRLSDLEVTQSGTVVVAFKSPSSAPVPFKNSAGHIAVKKAGQTTFSPALQVSTGGNGSGLRNTMHAIGEVVHMVFRYSSGGHNITYRAFDTEAMAFVGPQVVIDGPRATPASKPIANFHTSAFDDSERMYVAYGVGDTGATNDGQYKLAYADAPYTSWTMLKIADDFNVKGQTTDTKHISLVHTTGNDIHVLYSKISPPDSLDKLYTRQLVNGALTPETLLLTRTSDTFQTIWGGRAQQSGNGIVAIVQDQNPLPKRNIWYVNASGMAGRTRVFGKSCKGNLTNFPLLSTNRMPEAGKITPLFRMTMSKMPASSAGTLIVGANCLATPLDLGPFGAPGCQVIMSPFFSVANFTTDAQGAADVPVVLLSQYFGAAVNLHSFVLANGQNALGVLLSNGLMINP